MATEQPEHLTLQDSIDAMLAEPLDATTPESLRLASYLLGRDIDRKRNLDAYAYLAKLLLQHALALAERHPDQASEYQAAAIPLAYNLAANTWPGWGAEEVGEVLEHHLRLGLQAAWKNVELSEAADLNPARRSNGYWILGAQLLAAADFDAAKEAFATSRDYAKEAGEKDSEHMAQGWIHATAILSTSDEWEQLEAVKETLQNLGGDGPFFADQYDTALRALRPLVGAAERRVP